MAQLISEIWQGLRDAGLPEVMLYLDDNSASRCHWDETTMIGEVRVALLADQDRKIVRILPVDACTGIGIASPKGVDPSGYKGVVRLKLAQKFGGEIIEEPEAMEEPPEAQAPLPAAVIAPPAPATEPAAAPKSDTIASRFAVNMKAHAPANRVGPGSYAAR